jgi:hypothetical protein
MKQFGRHVDLFLADAAGKGLNFAKLRINFYVKKEDSSAPNTARIKIYGVAQDTVARIKKEFTEIILQAGYEENYGIIFRGNIKEVRTGRENGVETFVEISAGDGDAGYAYGTINKTLSAGARQNDIVNAAMIGEPGYIPDLGGEKLPRGKVMYGMKRDVLRASASSTDTTWSIQDGKMQFLPLTGLLPGQALVLNSKTGLIGTPEQTTEGVKGKCLLNPMLKIGSRLVIDEKDVASIKLQTKEKQDQKDKEPAKIAADGQYRLLKVEYKGDTHANDWFAEFVCLDVDASAPAGKKVKK